MFKKSKFGGTFRRPIFFYFANSQCNSLSVQRFFHRVHGVGLGFFGEVDVRLLGFAVGMAGEFHDDLGGDADDRAHIFPGFSFEAYTFLLKYTARLYTFPFTSTAKW